MSYNRLSFSSRKHHVDIKYEHIVRANRALSMANDINPDKQQDNRLQLKLEAIDKQKQVVLRQQHNIRGQSAAKLPAAVSSKSAAAKRHSHLAQDRLNKTLRKYGLELPILRKSLTAPEIRLVEEEEEEANHAPGSGGRSGGCSPRGEEKKKKKKTCKSATIPRYSTLYNTQSYSVFCEKLQQLKEQKRAMTDDISRKDPHSQYLPYSQDMNLYLREYSRLYNDKVTGREEQEQLRWEEYQTNCRSRNVRFVKGPDIVQLSYLTFHWFVCSAAFSDVCVCCGAVFVVERVILFV